MADSGVVGCERIQWFTRRDGTEQSRSVAVASAVADGVAVVENQDAEIGSGVGDAAEHVGRVFEGVVHRVCVRAAALGEVGGAATAAADHPRQFADDLAGVDVDIVRDGDDELCPVGTGAEHGDVALFGNGVGLGAEFVHVGVDALDDRRRLADVDLFGVGTA